MVFRALLCPGVLFSLEPYLQELPVGGAMINGFVHIIESPNDRDLLKMRLEGRSLTEAMNLAGVPWSYSLATTKAAFIESLGARLSQAYEQLEKRMPILHLSMHGNDEGLALTNGEFITWHELRELLLPLIDAMNGALLLCISACSGFSAVQMAMYEDEHQPFWALVTHLNEARWSDASVAFITFYHLFFKEKSMDECVAAMKVASGDQNFVHRFGQDVRQHYVERLRNIRVEALTNALAVARQPAAGMAAGLEVSNSLVRRPIPAAVAVGAVEAVPVTPPS